MQPHRCERFVTRTIFWMRKIRLHIRFGEDIRKIVDFQFFCGKKCSPKIYLRKQSVMRAHPPYQRHSHTVALSGACCRGRKTPRWNARGPGACTSTTWPREIEWGSTVCCGFSFKTALVGYFFSVAFDQRATVRTAAAGTWRVVASACQRLGRGLRRCACLHWRLVGPSVRLAVPGPCLLRAASGHFRSQAAGAL